VFFACKEWFYDTFYDRQIYYGSVFGNIHKYRLKFGNKFYDVKLIADKVEDAKDMIGEVKNLLHLRNDIVYCELDEYELTVLFREFVYHFDKEQTLGHFFKYAKFILGLNQIDDKEFVIYLNDMNFTEKRFLVHELYNVPFSQLLYTN
jgi:hypothetical protein